MDIENSEIPGQIAGDTESEPSRVRESGLVTARGHLLPGKERIINPVPEEGGLGSCVESARPASADGPCSGQEK